MPAGADLFEVDPAALAAARCDAQVVTVGVRHAEADAADARPPHIVSPSGAGTTAPTASPARGDSAHVGSATHSAHVGEEAGALLRQALIHLG